MSLRFGGARPLSTGSVSSKDDDMPNLKDIRKRIDSVKNTRKITRAMKMVAAAKLKKAQQRMEESRPYAYRMQRMIDALAERIDDEAHPLLERRENPHKTLVIIIASDRGLCGGFNTNLFRGLDRFLDEQRIAGEVQELACVGSKAFNHYKKSDYELVEHYEDVIGDISFKKAKGIAKDMREQFVDESYDSVYLCYNRFISAIANEWVIYRILPLADALQIKQSEEEEGGKKEAAPATDAMGREYLYEPELDTLLDELLPGHIDIQVMQALLESEASEQASRMTAMDNATNNANDMIEDLTLEYNRARQAYITKEIVEIVSGAESLKG